GVGLPLVGINTEQGASHVFLFECHGSGFLLMCFKGTLVLGTRTTLVLNRRRQLLVELRLEHAEDYRLKFAFDGGLRESRTAGTVATDPERPSCARGYTKLGAVIRQLQHESADREGFGFVESHCKVLPVRILTVFLLISSLRRVGCRQASGDTAAKPRGR